MHIFLITMQMFVKYFRDISEIILQYTVLCSENNFVQLEISSQG